jgi:cysteine sulfinate desulfinase/cysteine desulfurase-like protein
MERVKPGTAGDGRPAGWPAEPVYLGDNATTPVDAREAEAARPYWDQRFGNRTAATPTASSPGRQWTEHVSRSRR